MAAYMRDQFSFLGVPTPVRRKATAAALREPRPTADLLRDARALWALPEREYQYVAADLLLRQWARLSMSDLDAVLALACDCAWWDTVDALAHVVGNIVLAARATDPHAQRAMDAALGHTDLWVRRIAMLHQLGWRGQTDTARLFAYALTLAHEPDFFIRKAIGWALRDYAHHDPDAVRAFLDQHGARLSALSVREAGKHLGRG